jgi:hypothetical protein
VFDTRLEDTETWTSNTNIHSAFEKVGEVYKIKDSASGANYYISEEDRQNALKEKGITLGDNKPQIDFFIMSYCPYGNQAEIAIEPVFQLLGDKVDFNPHYVVYANYGGGGTDYCMDNGNYCSMHGIQELHQDIRKQREQVYGNRELFQVHPPIMMNAFSTQTPAEAVAKASA